MKSVMEQAEEKADQDLYQQFVKAGVDVCKSMDHHARNLDRLQVLAERLDEQDRDALDEIQSLVRNGGFL